MHPVKKKGDYQVLHLIISLKQCELVIDKTLSGAMLLVHGRVCGLGAGEWTHMLVIGNVFGG